MDVSDYLPPSSLVIPWLAFDLCAFENQRWNRAISAGRRGSNQTAMLLVAATGFAGLLLRVATYGLVWWDEGFVVLLCLIAAGVVTGLIASTLVGTTFGDSPVVWVIATLAMYPIGYMVFSELGRLYL